MSIDLSKKQSKAWHYLESNPKVSETFYGGGAGCFSANTLVQTSTGHIPISQIKVGDSVLSVNIDSGVSEFKIVLETFTYPQHTQTESLCIFEFKNYELKCTENHEFYFEGAWHRAGYIAKRAMEIRVGHGQPLSNIEHGSAIDNRLEGFKTTRDNETHVGCTRVFENHDKDQLKNWNGKDSQGGCTIVDIALLEQGTGEPYQYDKDGQPRGKLGMGIGKGELRTRCKEWQRWFPFREGRTTTPELLCSWFKGRNGKVDRNASNGNTCEVQTKEVHTSNVGRRIWGSTEHDKGRYSEKLEARCIRLDEILSVRLEPSTETVYDLCVEDNHNYCITLDNILVHNSGKSWFGCVWHINRRMQYAGSRGLIGRAKISALEQSTLVTLFEVAHIMGYQVGVDFNYNSQKHTVNWSNGSVTVLKDLFLYPSDPDFISLGSTEYTDAFIDEVTEITEKAYDIVSSRIRYKLDEYGLTPKVLSTGNPRKNWVKKKFVDPEALPEHITFVQSLLSDNPNDKFKELYEQQLGRMRSDYDKQRLLYGNWDADEEVNNPFAFNWSDKDHIKPCYHSESRQLIISMDFNIEPFAFIYSHVWQDKSGFHCHIFMEETIEKGSVHQAVTNIRHKFHHYLWNCVITGDYNGNKKELGQSDNASNFEQIRRELGLSARQIQTSPNPKHSNSRNDLNFVLFHSRGLPHDIDFRIDPRCPNTIRDMKFVEADGEGGIVKTNRKHAHEKADHLDAVRYLVNHDAVQKYIRYRQKLYI